MLSDRTKACLLTMAAAILIGKAAGAEPPAPAAMTKPQIAKGDAFASQLSELAGVEKKQVASALKEASEHIRIPGQSRWVKVGNQSFKFVGKASGPAGMVISVAQYAIDAAEIEQKFERGDLTREEANTAQGKLLARTAGEAVKNGATSAGFCAGAVIGTFVCPGPGTVIGGIVGAVGGYVGAELMMAATGVTDALAEYLVPGVEGVRKACSVIKEKGIEVTVAARDRLREWVGPDNFDQTIAALDNAVTWTGDKAKQAGDAVKEKAAYVKDKTVEGATKVGEAVSSGASWTRNQAESGWGYLCRKFE